MQARLFAAHPIIALPFGIMVALSMPPVYALPLLVPGFAVLAAMVARAENLRRAFWLGWWWGLGFFATGLYWMCIALLTEPEKFAWLIPFTLIGLNGLIALFPACAMACLRWLNPPRGWLALSFACLWTLMEYGRGHLFTGFPWNLPAYTLAFSDALPQAASVVGAYGLSFAVVLIAVLPLHGKRGAAFALLLVASLFMFGTWRLHVAVAENVQGVQLRLVQGNIAQHHKWQPELQMRHFGEYMRLTREPGIEKATHVIWPETAIPFALNREPGIISLLRGLAPENGALVAGTLRVEGTDTQPALWNTLAVITRKEGVVDWYDKHHLVPFGEYLPLRSLLPPEWLTPVGAVDFQEGPGPRLINMTGAPPALPLICYEAIFPEDSFSAARPDWLLNITNDAWFGTSTGPYQHLAMARFRAIEQGVPLVRAANTGISVVTDAYGRVVASLGLNEAGALDSALPIALPSPTIYGSMKDNILLPLMIMTIAYCYIIRKSSVSLKP